MVVVTVIIIIREPYNNNQHPPIFFCNNTRYVTKLVYLETFYILFTIVTILKGELLIYFKSYLSLTLLFFINVPLYLFKARLFLL